MNKIFTADNTLSYDVEEYAQALDILSTCQGMARFKGSLDMGLGFKFSVDEKAGYRRNEMIVVLTYNGKEIGKQTYRSSNKRNALYRLKSTKVDTDHLFDEHCMNVTIVTAARQMVEIMRNVEVK